MSYKLIEDSLKHIPNADRFELVHEVVKLAKSAPLGTDKPILWALEEIAKSKEEQSS